MPPSPHSPASQGVSTLPLLPPRASLRATVSCTGVHARHTSPGLQELTKLNAPRRVLGQTRTPRLLGASFPGSRRTTPGREGLDGTGRGARSLQCCVQGPGFLPEPCASRATGEALQQSDGGHAAPGASVRPTRSLCCL